MQPVLQYTYKLKFFVSSLTGGELDQRRYIDPAIYADLMELLSTFTTEMERSKTKLEELIGQGKEDGLTTSLTTLCCLVIVIGKLLLSFHLQGNLLMSTKER